MTINELLDMMKVDPEKNEGSVQVELLSKSIVDSSASLSQLVSKLDPISTALSEISSGIAKLSEINPTPQQTSQVTQPRIENANHQNSSSDAAVNHANDTLLNAPLDSILNPIVDAIHEIGGTRRESAKTEPTRSTLFSRDRSSQGRDPAEELERRYAQVVDEESYLLQLNENSLKARAVEVESISEQNKLRRKLLDAEVASQAQNEDINNLKIANLEKELSSDKLSSSERAKKIDEIRELGGTAKYDFRTGASQLSGGKIAGQGFAQGAQLLGSFKELGTVIKTTGGPLLLLADTLIKMVNSVVNLGDLVGAVSESIQLVGTSIITLSSSIGALISRTLIHGIASIVEKLSSINFSILKQEGDPRNLLNYAMETRGKVGYEGRDRYLEQESVYNRIVDRASKELTGIRGSGAKISATPSISSSYSPPDNLRNQAIETPSNITDRTEESKESTSNSIDLMLYKMGEFFNNRSNIPVSSISYNQSLIVGGWLSA